MLALYIAALIFGGGLLAMSVLGGHGDAHGDAGGHDAAHGAHATTGDLFALVASLRFWSFLLAFGGGTGSILSLLHQPPTLSATVAGGVGLACGLAAAWGLRALSRNQLSSSMSAEDWNGRSAKVVLPVSAVRPGKVRLDLDNEVMEVMAVAAPADGTIAVGEDVIVIEMDGGVAMVSPHRPKDLPRTEATLPGRTRRQGT